MVASLAIVVAILAGLIPENGFLSDPKTNDILKSPFMSGIVSIIFFGGALAGIAYGIGAKTIRSDSDVMKGMGKAMETLGSYMVLVFFAAQFVAYFNKSNLGLIIAVEGSTLLKSLNLGEIPLMISFVILTSVLNLFMGSASAKWAIMAPVFIPMFMLLGYSPEFTQVAYRVGDSVSNVISPMMSYFALIIAMIQRYDKGAGLGTLISTMVPFTIVFFIVWSLVLGRMGEFGFTIGTGFQIVLSVNREDIKGLKDKKRLFDLFRGTLKICMIRQPLFSYSKSKVMKVILYNFIIFLICSILLF